jgi:rhamnulokinase
MSRQLQFLAADLGAESGRVMRAGFDGDRLSLEEVHRFDSRPVRLPDGLHTNVLQILAELVAGMAAAARRGGGELASVAVDTWGVDFALLDAQGALLGTPHHYRDSLSDGMLERALASVSRQEIFLRTGIGFMEINTLYQLLGLRCRGSAALDAARSLLMISDLFTYWLCGRRCNELPIATTSQCLDTRSRAWALDLVERLGLPTRVFGEIVEPGTVVGELLPHVAEEAGIPRVPVIAAGGHDTALAMAAVPARGKDFAYLSSGTWSLLGTELEEPSIDARGLAANVTNEGGVCGTTRFLKNLCGLWIVQECRRTWARQGGSDTYDDLVRMASSAPPLRSLVDVDHPDFAKPADMPDRIRAFCGRTGQPVPEGKGEVVRCALDSLALQYRRARPPGRGGARRRHGRGQRGDAGVGPGPGRIARRGTRPRPPLVRGRDLRATPEPGARRGPGPAARPRQELTRRRGVRRGPTRRGARGPAAGGARPAASGSARSRRRSSGAALRARACRSGPAPPSLPWP